MFKSILTFTLCAVLWTACAATTSVLLSACGTITSVTDPEGNTTTVYTPPTPEELQAQIAAAQIAVSLAMEAIEAYEAAETAEEQAEAEEAYQQQALWLALANAWISANGGEAVVVPKLQTE